MKYLPSFFFLILLNMGCKTTNQHYTPQTYEGAQIKFGNGGGFTGAISTHILLENGQLFQLDSRKKDTIEIPRLDEKLTAQMFSSFLTLGIDKLQFKDPGNLYYFLGLHSSDQNHEIIWGGLEKIDPAIDQYYINLMQLVKRQKTAVQ